jgi:hypothetical protein
LSSPQATGSPLQIIPRPPTFARQDRSGADTKELTMNKPHPVHALEKNLEAARLEAVEELASREGALARDALRDLAAIQAALTAVRQEIDDHGAKLGWGGNVAALD